MGTLPPQHVGHVSPPVALGLPAPATVTTGTRWLAALCRWLYHRPTGETTQHRVIAEQIEDAHAFAALHQFCRSQKRQQFANLGRLGMEKQ